MAKFKVGDVVELNSGGIKMTVYKVSTKGITLIYSERTKLIEKVLPVSMLTKSSNDDIPVKITGMIIK